VPNILPVAMLHLDLNHYSHPIPQPTPSNPGLHPDRLGAKRGITLDAWFRFNQTGS